MRGTRAYTVIEMLTVLFVIVIVGALIAPGLGQLMKRGKVSSSVAAVSGVLRTARSLAIARNDVYHVLAQAKSTPEGEEFWMNVVWVEDEDQRYALTAPDWASVAHETLQSTRLEGKTRLTSAPALFFWPDGSAWWDPAFSEAVFTVEVEDPDEHDAAVRILVRASGVVEELP